METYKSTDFKKVGIKDNFTQENHSKSKKNVLRGLHYQLNPKAQGKLVRVINGAVIDVAVDLRKGSPYYGKHISIELSTKNKNMLWIPPGFAHGFYSLEDKTELVYKTTDEYSPEDERSIIWNDKDLAIVWPEQKPILCKKDMIAPSFKDAENNFVYDNEEKK